MISRSIGFLRTKKVIAAFVALALVGGIVLSTAGTGAASVQRERGARAKGGCIRALITGNRVNAVLSELVGSGTINQEQADAIVARIADEVPDPAERSCKGLALLKGGVGAAVRSLLDLERGDLRLALRDGESLAELAESAGVSRETLIDTITGAIQERLDQAVEREVISPELEAQIMSEIQPRIESLIDFHRGDLRKQRDAEEAATPVASPAASLEIG